MALQEKNEILLNIFVLLEVEIILIVYWHLLIT